MYILKILIFLQLFFLVISNQNINPSPRTGPQDLLVTHYDCEENEQKTLPKSATFFDNFSNTKILPTCSC